MFNPVFLLFGLKGLLAGIYIKFYDSIGILIGTTVVSVGATYWVIKSNPHLHKKNPPAFLDNPQI